MTETQPASTDDPRQDETAEAAAETKSSWWHTYLSPEWTKSLPRWFKLVAFLVAVAGLAWATRALDHAQSLAYRAYWSFSPPVSAIYVDSPEVYTRERLINERSTEEAWLNDQLKRIDTFNAGPTIVNKLVDNMEIGLGERPAAQPEGSDAATGLAGGQQPDTADGNASEPGQASSLTFDQDFRLKSAYRSLVRQRMIENRLDDRHDLDGNSLYILKFDSTVFGIPAVHERAIIKVSILPPAGLAALGAADAADFLLALDTSPNVLEYARNNFKRWESSLAARFNATLEAELRRFLSEPPGSNPRWREVVDRLDQTVDKAELGGRSIEEVLKSLTGDTPTGTSAPPKVIEELYLYFGELAVAQVTGEDQIDVRIARPVQHVGSEVYAHVESPLSRDYVSVWMRFTPTRSTVPKLQVGPVISNVILTDAGCAPSGKDTLPDYFSSYFANQQVELWQHFQQQIPADDDMMNVMVNRMVEIVRASPRQAPGVFRFVPRTGGKCQLDVGIEVESGLVSFARRIGRYNTYSYSVLPRESPIGVFNEIVKTARVAAELEAIAARRDRQDASSAWELRPVLTTFGDTVRRSGTADSTDDKEEMSGRRGASGAAPESEPVVGWILDLSAQIVGRDRMLSPATISESVVAIVSVPAWWSDLTVSIEKGWLTRLVARKPSQDSRNALSSYSVKLPSRPELMDTLLFGDVGRQPKITGVDKWPDSGTPYDCSEFSVLIRGLRLWRNTAVTIGNTKADEIEVLPNMEGIIAKFRPTTSKSLEVKGKLRVWTSDGVDNASGIVALQRPEC